MRLLWRSGLQIIRVFFGLDPVDGDLAEYPVEEGFEARVRASSAFAPLVEGGPERDPSTETRASSSSTAPRADLPSFIEERRETHAEQNIVEENLNNGIEPSQNQNDILAPGAGERGGAEGRQSPAPALEEDPIETATTFTALGREWTTSEPLCQLRCSGCMRPCIRPHSHTGLHECGIHLEDLRWRRPPRLEGVTIESGSSGLLLSSPRDGAPRESVRMHR